MAPPSCLLITPYFGSAPNYFQLWLDSCARNPTVRWLLLGDIAGTFDLPDNVSYHPLSFDAVVGQVQKPFPFRVALEHPIKLCDFRPAFAEIFPELVAGYDFWGHCDLDVIWGRLRHFLRPDILDSYDKIFTGGHLSLYRNTAQVNAAYRSDETPLGSLHKEIFSTPELQAFDEWGPAWNGMNSVVTEAGLRLYTEDMPYADVKVRHWALRTTREGFGSPAQMAGERGLRRIAYRWDQGRLTQYALSEQQLHVREEAYIHLQKRPMVLQLDERRPQRFAIVPPNRFVTDPGPFDAELLRATVGERGFYPHAYRLRLESLKRKALSARRSQAER